MRVYRWAWQARIHHWFIWWVAGDDIQRAQFMAFAAGWLAAYGKRSADRVEWSLIRGAYRRWVEGVSHE